MRVVVDNYAYSLIKISSLKNLNISQEKFKELKQIKEIKVLLDELDSFFPGISKISEINLVELEKNLFSIYFKILEKIIASTPTQMQDFLKVLLFRFEIWNLKTYILGMLTNMSIQQIKEELMMDPERILGKTSFIQKLLGYTNVKDAIEFLSKDPQYGKLVKRGWYFFNETNEIFLLEALFDKHFHDELIHHLEDYTGLEKAIFRNYIDFLIEKYNLYLIYRGIKNQIPKDLLQQLVIKQSILFSGTTLEELIASETTHEFYQKVEDFCSKYNQKSLGNIDSDQTTINYRKKLANRILNTISKENVIQPILSEIFKDVFSRLTQASPDNIKLITIEKILTFIMIKEREIYKVLGLFVKILHEIKD